jgi:hypothetical protein
MSENHSDIYGPYYLDLWPSIPNIDRDNPLVITNMYVKYDNFQTNKWKPFWHLKPHVTLTFELLTQNQLGVILFIWLTNQFVKYEDFVINSFQDNKRQLFCN